MADTKARIEATLILAARDGIEVGGGRMARGAIDYPAYVAQIMDAVKHAIENPGESPELDATLVYTALGKRGTRADTAPPIGAAVMGDKRVEFAPDPAIEIYCRVYAIERENSDAATARAMAGAAAATFPIKMVLAEGVARGA